MKRRRTLYLINLLSTVAVLFALVYFASCSEPDTQVNGGSGNMSAHEVNGEISDLGHEISYDEAGNKIITVVRKGLPHFSMGYPDGFELDLIKIDDSPGWEILSVYFSSPVAPDGCHSVIIISNDEYPYNSGAESDAKDSLDFWGKQENFKLLDESTVTVAGVTAYQISFYYDRYPYDPHTLSPETVGLRVTNLWRYVYFDHSGLTWEIHLGTDPSREEQDIVIFNRVLETFKVLE